MSSGSNCDDVLDLLSESFDPIKALYADNVKVPCANAQPQDNISKFEMSSTGEVTIKCDKPKKITDYDYEPVVRDLSNVAGSSQMSLVERVRKPRRTIFKRMSEIGKSGGPLSRIATLCYQKQRAKVYIRSAVNVRGYCEGYIIAYDKHWNLVMDNVTEIWTKKNKYKPLPIGNMIKMEPETEKQYTVLRRTRGHQVCQRHVPRFMVRGEQIVLVAKCRS